MGPGVTGKRRGVFAGAIAAALVACLLQSGLHLAVVLGDDRVGSLFDLDRSNGVPDVISTLVLAAAFGGAAGLAACAVGRERMRAAGLAVMLGGLTAADAAHVGPHPSSVLAWLVITLVVLTGVLLAFAAVAWSDRSRVAVAVAACTLAASFLVNALDRLDAQRFERERGDAIAEYQIVVKEGLELLGWSLVALVLWDEAARRRRAVKAPATEPASRARAASKPRAA